MKKIFIAVVFLIMAVMAGCGKTKEETQEQDEKSCLILEDEDCIYVCGTYRLLKMDKATGEAVFLWENEGAAKKQAAYLYSEGQGILLNDKIYFIEAWMEEDAATEHKALSVINTDGTDYCRIEEIPGYSDDSMALIDGILYVDVYHLPQDGTGSMLSYAVLKDGTLAENIEAADMEEYAGIPEGYMHSSYHSSGQRTLFTAEALKNFGYMILENEDYELVKVMPDTGEEISMSSEFGILYSYNDNYFLTGHYGADKGFYLYDRETMESKLLFEIKGGAEIIDMDQDYVYVQYSRIDGKEMEDGARKNVFEKISLGTGERTVIFEKDVQKGMEYDFPQLLSDMVVKNGYLYYVGEENYKLYLMRRSLNSPETEEKLGEAFYDTGIGEVGTIVSYYEEFYSKAVPDIMLAYVDLEWLKVDERFSGAEEINRYLTEYQNNNIEYERSNSGWLEEILEEDDTGAFEIPYSYSGSLSEIDYFDEVYLSFCQLEYDYTGGAHGMPCRIGFTFELETGRRLFLKDVMENNEEELKDIVTEYFAEYIGKNPGDFWEGSVDYVRECTDLESPFYLTEEGIAFYFAPYELAPYAGGFQEVTIPYEEFEMKIQVNPPDPDYYGKYQEMPEPYGEPGGNEYGILPGLGDGGVSYALDEKM